MKNDDRVLLRSLERYAAARGLRLSVTSLGWIATLSSSAKRHHVFGYDLGLNSSSALRIANDKAATATLLQDAGLAAVPHRLFVHPELFPYVDVEGNWGDMLKAFHDFGEEVVVKDNEGTGGRHVYRATSLADLETAVTRTFEKCRALTLSPLRSITRETRVVMLDNIVFFAYAKERPWVKGDGRRTIRSLIDECVSAGTLAFTDDAWAALDCDLAHVPHSGEVVSLQWRHNLGMGATPELLDVEARAPTNRSSLLPNRPVRPWRCGFVRSTSSRATMARKCWK